MLDVLDRLIVHEFVRSLPPRERLLAELLMAGHTQRSAARALHIPVRTARRRMLRIASRLQHPRQLS